MSKILNFNIGVLGHVDSGKTSLSKGLSTIASTAAFDKNPGIYLVFLSIIFSGKIFAVYIKIFY